MTTPPTQPWTADIWHCMRHQFLLKVVGTTAFTWLFFLAYFHLLRHPAHPVFVMPLTALDSVIAFQPWGLFAYVSLWLYVGIAPGLQPTFRELIVYTFWVGALCATGLGMFYFWPTAVPAFTLDVAGVPGFRMLQGVDAAGNACPSMHVAIAMFTVIRIEHLLRSVGAPAGPRLFNLAWFLAIAWSTLAIRQHVVLDVAAGALLGAAFAVPSLHGRPQPRRALGAQMAPAIIETLQTDIAP